MQRGMPTVNGKSKKNILSPPGRRQPDSCHLVEDSLWWDTGSEAQTEDGYEPRLPTACTSAA